MWSVPPLWPGRTVAVLASGESMRPAVAEGLRAARIPSIVVNSTFRLMLDADLLYAADRQWWDANPAALKFRGLKVTCTEPADGVERIRNAGTIGYSDETDCVHTYGNSGMQALQIAVKGGASKVLLFGMDMTGGHWHGDHPAPLEKTSGETFERWLRRIPLIVPELEARSVDVVNCSAISRIECFRRSTLEAEIAACAEPAAA